MRIDSLYFEKLKQERTKTLISEFLTIFFSLLLKTIFAADFSIKKPIQGLALRANRKFNVISRTKRLRVFLELCRTDLPTIHVSY